MLNLQTLFFCYNKYIETTLNAKLYEMKYLFLLFTLSILSCSKSDESPQWNAQVLNKQISNTFSEYPNDAVVLPTGNLGVLVTSKENSGLKYITLNREDGSVMESKSILSQSNIFGKYLLSNQTSSFILADVEQSAMQRNIKCIKISESSVPIHEFDILSDHHEVAIKMINKTDSGYIILANRKDKTTENWGFVLYETDGLQIINTHVFPHPILQSSSDIIQKKDGSGYYVFAHVIDDPLNSTDFVLYELDNSLQVSQKKYFGGDQYEEARQILEDHAGQLYLFGHSASDDIEHQMYLVKLDADLNIQFEKHYGSEYHDGGQALCFDGNQRLTLIGRTDAPNNTNESIYYLKINTNGNVLDKMYLGDESANRSDIVLHENGVDYVIGYTTIDNAFTRNIELFRIEY